MSDENNQDIDNNQNILEAGNVDLSAEIIRREYKLSQEARTDAYVLSDYITYLWMIYADFQMMIVSPFVETKEPPVLIQPAFDEKTQMPENVYAIMDYGYAFRTSRGEEMALGTTAMGKLYNTINKIIKLVMKRLEEKAGGAASFDPQKEIKLALSGYELGKRKAFALVMDLEANVNIVNFDPRLWGERFIANLKNMIAMGHGYPSDLKHVSARIAPSSN